MKKILICLISIIIIILTFIIPSILFKIEDMQSEKRAYSKTKFESKIDVEAQKIYLVKVIHAIEDGNLNLKVNNMYDVSKLVENEKISGDKVLTKFLLEIKNLKDNNVIGKIITEEAIVKYEGQERTYNDTKVQYSINQANLSLKNQERIYIEIESKTGKVLLYSGMLKEIEEMSQEEILRNYVQYLGLYIIDDWKYIDNMLTSEKAKLSAMLVDYDNAFYLSIHSNNNINIYKNLDEK